MSSLDLIRPSPRSAGQLAWSGLKDWQTCQMLWYNRRLRPHPNGEGQGCEPLDTPQALSLGSLFHLAIEEWYRSGWRNGQYQHSAGLNAIEAARSELIDERGHHVEEAEAVMAQAKALFDRHASWCGPDGPQPEYPDVRILGDANDEPMLERTFRCDLGYGGYVFTSKLDAVVQYHGKVYAFEHKTCAATAQTARVRQFDIDPQFTGELWVLQQAWPELEFAGILANLVLKGAGRNKAPRRLEIITRTAKDMEVWRLNQVRKIHRIERHLDEYKALLDQGVDAHEAADMVFDSSPDGALCASGFYHRPCDYYNMCVHRGNNLRDFKDHTRPRVRYEEVDDAQEDAQ